MQNLCLIPLVEKFKNCEMDVFPAIFSQFEKLIGCYANRLDGEDTRQELCVFLVELLYKVDISSFLRDDTDQLKRYIAVCLRNKYISLLRQQVKHWGKKAVLCEDIQDIFCQDIFERQILKDALEGLSGKQRQIVIYKYIYNYSDCEIAEKFNITRQAVNRLKNRAMGNLREYYLGGM